MRCLEIACALGVVQLQRLEELLAARGIEEIDLPRPDAGGEVRGWFVFVVQPPVPGRPAALPNGA